LGSVVLVSVTDDNLADHDVHLGSSPFSTVFLFWTNWFSLQNMSQVGLASICHFLVLDPHLKALGSI
jgi:hypothetical protein